PSPYTTLSRSSIVTLPSTAVFDNASVNPIRSSNTETPDRSDTPAPWISGTTGTTPSGLSCTLIVCQADTGTDDGSKLLPFARNRVIRSGSNTVANASVPSSDNQRFTADTTSPVAGS